MGFNVIKVVLIYVVIVLKELRQVSSAGTCYLWLLNTHVATSIKSELLGFYYRNGTTNNMPRYLKTHIYGPASYIEVIHDTHKWIVKDGTRTTHARSSPTALDLVEEELSAPWQIWTTGSGWGVPVAMWFECFSRELAIAANSVRISIFPDQSPVLAPVTLVETYFSSCLSGSPNDQTCVGVTWRPYSKMCGCFLTSSDVCTVKLNPPQQPTLTGDIAIYIDKALCTPEGLRCTNSSCEDMCIITPDHPFCGCGPGRRIIAGTQSQCEDTEECQEDDDCHAHQSCLSHGRCHNSCSHGFHLPDSSNNTCKSTCAVPDDGENVMQNGPATIEVDVGETVSFTCEDSHVLVEGNLNRTCRLNFTWTGDPPVCLASQSTSAEPALSSTAYHITTTDRHMNGTQQTNTSTPGGLSDDDPFALVMAIGIGAGCGAFVVLVIIIIIVLLCIRRRRRNKRGLPSGNPPLTHMNENLYESNIYHTINDGTQSATIPMEPPPSQQSDIPGDEYSPRQAKNFIQKSQFKETMNDSRLAVPDGMYAVVHKDRKRRDSIENNTDGDSKDIVMVDNDIYGESP